MSTWCEVIRILAAHNVAIAANAPITESVALFKVGAGYHLALRQGLSSPEVNTVLTAIAVMFTLNGGAETWAWFRSLPPDATLRSRTEVYRTTAHWLISDELLERSRREGWNPQKLADVAETTVSIAALRQMDLQQIPRSAKMVRHKQQA